MALWVHQSIEDTLLTNTDEIAITIGNDWYFVQFLASADGTSIEYSYETLNQFIKTQTQLLHELPSSTHGVVLLLLPVIMFW